MPWANPTVASLALGDVVPGKMKGLVLKLGYVSKLSRRMWGGFHGENKNMKSWDG